MYVREDLLEEVRMDFNAIETAKKLWVYGYSNLGRNAFNKLHSIWPEKAAGIIVTKNNKRSLSSNKNIVEIENADISDSIIVIATNSLYHTAIIEKLKEKCAEFSNYIIYNEALDDWLNDKLKQIPLLETRLLAVSVGQACNYKCKDCANFVPFAKKENLRYEIDDIKKDLDIIMPYFSVIDKLHIQGGEPFVYSDLPALIEYISGGYSDKIKNIQIATNGSIVPSKAVLEALSKGKCTVRISNYKKGEAEKVLIKKLEEYGIKYEKYDFVGKKGEWKDSGGLNYVSPIDEDVYLKVLECGWSTCYTMENGIIGRCARSIPARSLQDIVIKKEDYINVRESIDIVEISKYFMFLRPMESCKHCKGSRGEPIKAAIQIGEEG